MVIKRKKVHRAAKRSATTLSSKRRTHLKKKAQKLIFSMQSPLRAYREIEHKIDKTWTKLRNDVKRRSRRAIIKGRRDLLLLLGECNYMAQECARCIAKKKR
jgi:hypothetical protein